MLRHAHTTRDGLCDRALCFPLRSTQAHCTARPAPCARSSALTPPTPQALGGAVAPGQNARVRAHFARARGCRGAPPSVCTVPFIVQSTPPPAPPIFGGEREVHFNFIEIVKIVLDFCLRIWYYNFARYTKSASPRSQGADKVTKKYCPKIGQYFFYILTWSARQYSKVVVMLSWFNSRAVVASPYLWYFVTA